jgi:hypothetical protein
MAKGEHDDPPLKSVVGYSYSPDGMPRLTITRRERGFLSDVEIREFKETKPKQPIKPDGTLALDALGKQLRDYLDSVGLPTDKWPVTPIELDFGYEPAEHGTVADDDLWIGYVEESTEPLTKNRIAADLLHTTNRILANCTADQLRDVFRAMKLYHLYATVGELNALALAGEIAERGREKGPHAKKLRARNTRKLILEIANEFWSRHPKLLGQPFNTAKKISDVVNKKRKVQDPSCAPLAAKTISDHLRVALREAQQQR